MSQARAPIAVALDTTDLQTVEQWTRAVAPSVTTVKVGLELFLSHGGPVIEMIRSIAPEIEIFLDLKLHDIPNTVRGAARAVAPLQPAYLTVHALGGPAMIESAVIAAPDTAIAAVTLLTSHSEDELESLGLRGSIHERALSLAQMSVRAGAKAIVCSPHEVRRLREALGDEVALITPGVRPRGSEIGDQRRVATPEEALRDGASLLVVGRPITGPFDEQGEAGVAEAAASLHSSIMTFLATEDRQ